jgi:ABC-2 type transport system ATP-binding protein
VDGVSAVALPGEVTALLGPNGAGKTTTLRMLLGLVAPSSGAATIGGRRYEDPS